MDGEDLSMHVFSQQDTLLVLGEVGHLFERSGRGVGLDQLLQLRQSVVEVVSLFDRKSG
jgi:hypothetical protein